MSLNITNTTPSTMTWAVGNITVPALSTDGATGTETSYQSTTWSQNFGYFNSIPELHSAFLMKSIWTCGKGFTTDPETMVILDHIIGWGKDTFRDVLFNADLVKNIDGDSFTEIIWDDKEQRLFPLNLKPLDPSTIKIIVDERGMLDHYEQVSKTGKPNKEFDKRDILHLSNCRTADQIHGISRIKAMEQTILAMNEGFVDMKKLMHFQGKPFIIWHLKTDNATDIAAFVAKVNSARKLGEDLFVPDDNDTATYEVVQLNPSAVVLEWQNALNNKFYRAVGMPLVLFGQAGTTESGGKIEYLGHEQVFENDQLYLEEQIWQQLHLKINLIPPTSLLENLAADQSKDAAQGMEVQQNDVTAGSGKDGVK